MMTTPDVAAVDSMRTGKVVLSAVVDRGWRQRPPPTSTPPTHVRLFENSPLGEGPGQGVVDVVRGPPPQHILKTGLALSGTVGSTKVNEAWVLEEGLIGLDAGVVVVVGRGVDAEGKAEDAVGGGGTSSARVTHVAPHQDCCGVALSRRSSGNPRESLSRLSRVSPPPLPASLRGALDR